MKPKVTNSSLLQQLQGSELAFSLGKYEIIHKFVKKFALSLKLFWKFPCKKNFNNRIFAIYFGVYLKISTCKKKLIELATFQIESLMEKVPEDDVHCILKPSRKRQVKKLE